MTKRDFRAESVLNFICRAQRAFISRLRGFIYRKLGMFYSGTGFNLAFGLNPRFINTKAMWFGNAVSFGISARLECFNGLNAHGEPRLIIGNGTSFGDNCHIGAANLIRIGENVLGGSGILIIDHNHGDPKKDLALEKVVDPKIRDIVSKKPILIGSNVWIGERVIILSGADIGDGAIIAPNTIVRGKVEPKTIYFGV